VAPLPAILLQLPPLQQVQYHCNLTPTTEDKLSPAAKKIEGFTPSESTKQQAFRDIDMHVGRIWGQSQVSCNWPFLHFSV